MLEVEAACFQAGSSDVATTATTPYPRIHGRPEGPQFAQRRSKFSRHRPAASGTKRTSNRAQESGSSSNQWKKCCGRS